MLDKYPHLAQKSPELGMSTPRNFLDYNPNSQSSPTPLDPYMVMHDGQSYIENAIFRLDDRVAEKARIIGLPEHYADSACAELATALDVRVDRNTRSCERLLTHVHYPDCPKATYNLIEKSRAGNANPSELLQLIKEHPEMISVEFFKSHAIFDTDEYTRALNELKAQVGKMSLEFKDAEITMLGEDELTTQPFITEHGAVVHKTKIGECRSVDSHTEIIAKHTGLLVPANIQLKGVKFNHRRINGGNFNFLPLGVTAYFRTADYKTRTGYVSPEDEIRRELTPDEIAELGSVATHLAEILSAIPPEMHSTYLDLFTQRNSSKSP